MLNGLLSKGVVSRMQQKRNGRKTGAAARSPCEVQVTGRTLESKHPSQPQYLHKNRPADPRPAGLSSTNPPPNGLVYPFPFRIEGEKRFRQHYLHDSRPTKSLSVWLHSTNLLLLVSTEHFSCIGCINMIFEEN